MLELEFLGGPGVGPDSGSSRNGCRIGSRDLDLGADDEGSHHCGWRSAAKDCRRRSRLLMVPVERITTELFCCILWNYVMEFWDILTQKGVLE